MKLSNFVKVAVAIAGGLLVSAIIVKTFKNELKETKKNGSEPGDESSDSKVNPEQQETGDILIDTLTLIKKSPEWDIHHVLINPGADYNNHTIHVFIRGRDLKLLIELPEMKKTDYSVPDIHEFIGAFKLATEQVSKILKYTTRPYTTLCGYFVLSYELADDPKHERRFMYSRVGKDKLNEFRDPTKPHVPDSRVLTRMINEIRKDLLKGKNELEFIPCEDRNWLKVRIEEVKLVWEMSFLIQEIDADYEQISRISPNRLEKCLKYLVDEMEVTGRGDKLFNYDSLLFYKSIDPELEVYEPTDIESGKFKIESYLIEL